MNIEIYVIDIICILLVTFIHEYSKSYTSYKLGDTSIKLTLNPFYYFEPIGFLLFLFTSYGWGNPTSTSSLNYKNRKKGILLTYTIPIIINLIFAIISLALFINIPSSFLLSFSLFNIKIAIFNLIPIYPLCGEKILLNILPPEKAFRFTSFSKPLQIIVILLLLTGYGRSFLNIITNFIYKLIFLILSLIF